MIFNKKTIFLDIDGVLCTEKEFFKSTKKFHEKFHEAKQLRVPYPFNFGCVKILNSILEETDAQIVLSSDWRHHWNIIELDMIFKFNGVIKSPVDVTGDYSLYTHDLEKNRVNEINIFRNIHNIELFVVIDDMNLDIYLTNRFVKTISNEGLKQTGIKDKIIKFLNDESK